jgi:hypothetical protein
LNFGAFSRPPVSSGFSLYRERSGGGGIGLESECQTLRSSGLVECSYRWAFFFPPSPSLFSLKGERGGRGRGETRKSAWGHSSAIIKPLFVWIIRYLFLSEYQVIQSQGHLRKDFRGRGARASLIYLGSESSFSGRMALFYLFSLVLARGLRWRGERESSCSGRGHPSGLGDQRGFFPCSSQPRGDFLRNPRGP